MRIAYGVHGYGRGHAMRSMAVAQRLVERGHHVTILAGQEAHEALKPSFDCVRIPMIGFYYNRSGHISNYQTITRNVPSLLDVKLKGATVNMVADIMRDVDAEVVISDSEVYSLAAAEQLGIPRVLLDHFGLLVYCKPELSGWDRVICRGESWIYHLLYGRPDHVIVSGFFAAEPRRGGVDVVGPIIRSEVRAVAASEGDHLLVYISKAANEFTDQIEQAIQSLDLPIIAYGSSKIGRCGHVEYKPFSNVEFIRDVAASRGVFATTGNQLIGELLHFEKPMLGMPIDCMEQRINAQYIERMGVGMQVQRGAVDARAFRTFLERLDDFKHALGNLPKRDGTTEAALAVERFLGANGSTI